MYSLQKCCFIFWMLSFFCVTVQNALSQETSSNGGALPAPLPLKNSGNFEANLKAKLSKKPVAVPFFKRHQKDDLENKGIITAEMQYLKNYKKNTKEFEGNFPKVNQNLGGFSTTSRNLVIFCRDHQAPDGDTVTIYLNDQPIVINVILQNSFQKFVIPLKEGVNTLYFKALNQGQSGPNTAQFLVFDENQQVICENQWNLATGAKAFLTIARDK